MNVIQPDAGSSSHVTELRRSQRVATCLEAVLFSEHGKVTGLIANLSRTGLCFEGDKALADLLLAGVRRATSDAPVIVKVRFDLPSGETTTMPVVVQARTVYVIHDDADVYQCGLEFSMVSAGEEALKGYLCERGVAD